MARITDVASFANVSTATVSRVIRSPDRVKGETREKVLQAIKTLNYQPNILARQLRRMETKLIVVVVPDITNPFFSNVLLGIEKFAFQHGYQVLLADSQNSVEIELKYLDLLKQKQADGLILLTARMEKEIIEEVSNQFPVVLACEYIEGSTIPTVSIDNISSARRMTEHLIQLGHQRIAFITGPMEVILSRDRLRGYQQALTQHELKIESILIQEGDFSVESGLNQMDKLLSLENPPTAVFAGNDEMAIGAMKAIKKQGLKVPSDIAVVGFDDIKFASIHEPALTTIAQPSFEIGRKAMEVLLDLIYQNSLTRRRYVLEEKLIIRESCGAL